MFRWEVIEQCLRQIVVTNKIFLGVLVPANSCGPLVERGGWGLARAEVRQKQQNNPRPPILLTAKSKSYQPRVKRCCRKAAWRLAHRLPSGLLA
jgi:hypothetical protein